MSFPKKVRAGRYKRWVFNGFNPHRGTWDEGCFEAGAPGFIDLFCGAGGSTLGLLQAGYDHWCGIDLNPDCLVTYQYNIGNAVMADMRHLPLRPALGEYGLKFVWGSPPCVSFSPSANTSRKRNPKTRERHERIAGLLIDFAKAVAYLCPMAIGFENVPQVKRHHNFKEMLRILQFECFPPYWISYKDLNAADYGVPQNRVRTILIGVQKKGVKHEYYEAHHVRKSRCPVCGQELTEYDIYAGGEKRPWVWSAGWFHPILGIEVMGALWLNKGIVHSMDDVHHVWIEWGTGREDRLLRYIGDEENEKAMAGLQEHMTTKQR